MGSNTKLTAETLAAMPPTRDAESDLLAARYGVDARSYLILGQAEEFGADGRPTGKYVTSFIVTVHSKCAIPHAGRSRKVPLDPKDPGARYYVYTQVGDSAFVGSYQTLYSVSFVSDSVGDPTTKPHPP